MIGIEKIDFFIFYIMPVLVLVFGWIGNLAGLFTIFKKDLSKLGPVLMYRILLVVDSICLFQVFTFYLIVFEIKTLMASQLACKLLIYIPISICLLSPYILVYISIERYISIKYFLQIVFFLIQTHRAY